MTDQKPHPLPRAKWYLDEGTVTEHQAGHFSAWSYRRGSGHSPFNSYESAETWVREQHARGAIKNYSR